MAGPLQYRKDLYAGTAPFYDRYRPGYPPALVDELRARVPLDANSRVLDLACGTGQIAFALAPHVGSVDAVDQEPETVAFGAAKARRLGVTDIRWVTGEAESVPLDAPYDLVAVGNAFHRLDRDAVAARAFPALRPGGCVALLWGALPWDATAPEGSWRAVLNEVVERWLDLVAARDRVPAGWEEVMARDPHEAVLQRAGFGYEGTSEVTVEQRWTVESLIGLLYSTSLLSPSAVGDRAPDFEADLRSKLLACCPDGAFLQDFSFACQLARRP